MPRRWVPERPIHLPVRGGGHISEGWPLQPHPLPRQVGGGLSAGPLASPRFASAGRLQMHGFLPGAGSSLPVPSPTLGQRLECLECGS